MGIDERRQLGELLKTAQEVPENYEGLTSQVPKEPRREPEEPSRDDLDDCMGTGDQLTPPEESGETVPSKEIGGQSTLWKERRTNDGQPAPVEIPDEETAGSPQFKRACLEESLDNELEKMREDDTSRIGLEEILMTKNPGLSTTSTSSNLDKRQYDREISFHQLPEGDVPLYQEAERVQRDEWVTHGSVKIRSPVEAAKIRQQVPRERRVSIARTMPTVW